uniref:Mitochondrial import inner membrane translocase subunit Tim21 n=1 Tax=Macrostomum lignano TaxID=282301 RepID=A0A1I8I8S0_9PLAT
SLVLLRGPVSGHDLVVAARAALFKRCHSNPGASNARAIISVCLRRYQSTDQKQQQQQQQQQKQTDHAQQLSKSVIFVVEGSKDFGYTLVVLAGVLVTGGLFYALWRELYSSESPTALQSLATERCLQDPQVQAALGEPIRSHGDGSSRRSRSRVHSEESLDSETGQRVMSLRFHLVGQFNRADVYAQGVKLKLLVVELQQYPKRVIVLEKPDKPPPPPPSDMTLLGSAGK